MAELPLVTVVIPTWNRLPLVEEAVASVAAQTYPSWELVVVDDGSTDGTAGRLRALGDPRVRVLELPRTGHPERLRNLGAAAGSGELVAFLDSDDVWLPRKLDIQVRALRSSGAGWCYGGFEMMDEGGRTIPTRVGRFRPLSGHIAREVLTTEAAVFVGTLLLPRRLFEAVGGFSEDPRVAHRGDHELHLRLALRAEAVAVPEVLTRAREHPRRTTACLADPHERTALVYELFLVAGAERLAAGQHARAGALFARALAHRPEPGHWARALARGLRGRLRSLVPSRTAR